MRTRMRGAVQPLADEDGGHGEAEADPACGQQGEDEEAAREQRRVGVLRREIRPVQCLCPLPLAHICAYRGNG